jgi:regulation of enolase protein 1 (concanavalin A-like superfamily)
VKKIMALIFAVALIGVFCMACNEPENQGTDVSFTEYSLAGELGKGFSGHWKNLDYDNDYNGRIIIINNNEELQNYVEGESSPIDFSQKTLVLAYGCNSGSAFGFDVKFQKMSDQNYVMTASTWANAATVVVDWQIAIVADKLPSESRIKFNGIILTKS